MPIVGGGITGNAQSRGGTPSPEKTQELIDQAVQTFFTPEKIEELGYAQSEDIPTDAEITTIATDTITPLIDGFLSESEIEALGYQTADEVAALIAPRIAGFLTQAQIEMLGYIDTAGANTLINQALTSYAQSDEIRTDAEINTLITSMLSGYAQSSDIRTDAEITAIATSVLTPMIADFLTQAQIESLGYQTAAEVTALITPRIADFLTQAQIEALGYLDTAAARTLITAELSAYAQSSDIRTDAEINTLITAMLSGYARTTDLRTDAQLTTFVTDTVSPLIMNFLTQAQIEALGYQSATEVATAIASSLEGYATTDQLTAARTALQAAIDALNDLSETDVQDQIDTAIADLPPSGILIEAREPTDADVVDGIAQVFWKTSDPPGIYYSRETESTFTEFPINTAEPVEERFIFIADGENFPEATAENTDKILIDRRGDIPRLYANRVTDIDATEDTWTFGEIDTTQFPDYLGAHDSYTGPRRNGQYLYRTDQRQWFQNDGTSFVQTDPTAIFTQDGVHYVASYDTEAAAIAALPSDYTETDTYIFVIGNEPRQLRSYTPAVDAYTTYEWEQINTLPAERQGVGLLNEQEVGLRANTLHSVPNLNDSIMQDYERFYCTIKVEDNQVGGFTFGYDAWAALPTENEQTDISGNSSLQVGILRVNSTNNIHIGARNNNERSFMIALRGLSGTSLGNPANCHISVWGYKH